MKLNKNAALDFVEQDILYCWGCESWPATMRNLINLYDLTVNPDIRERIMSMIVKLIVQVHPDEYQQIFNQYGKSMKDGIKRKINAAKKLAEMEGKVM